MSYSILYRRVFVRLSDDTFVALVESGDNNVRESDNRRRARSWNAWNFGTRKSSVTRQDVLSWLNERYNSAVREARDGQDARRRFGWYEAVSVYGRHTSTTSFGAVRAFFMKGLEKAVSLADFVKASGGFRLSWYEREDGSDVETYKTSGTLTTQESLKEAFDEVLGRTGKAPWIIPAGTYRIGMLSDVLWSESPNGLNLEAVWEDSAGRNRAFVKSFFPLSFTYDRAEAFRFSKPFIRKSNLFGIMQYVAPEKEFVQFSFS